MLKKIQSIKNVGRLQNYVATGNVEFGKFTLIYGENGRGKSTLCAILRSLKTGEAAHITGRKTLGASNPPSLTITSNSGTCSFNGTSWSQTLPNLMVFDDHFIKDNIHTGHAIGTDQRRNLYKLVIGQEGVQLAIEHETLTTEIKQLTQQIAQANRDVLPHLAITADIPYLLSLTQDPEIDPKLEDAQAQLTACQEADLLVKQSLLSPIELPVMPLLEDTLNLTLQDVSVDVERRVKEHLASHSMRNQEQAWLTQGMEYNRTNGCPFCGQSITQVELIQDYTLFFTEGYKGLKQSVVDIGQAVSRTFGDGEVEKLKQLVLNNSELSNFWSRYIDFTLPPLSLDASSLETLIKEVRNEALTVLRLKASSPLEVIEVPQPLIDSLQRYDELKNVVLAYNTQIQNMNTTISTKKTTVQAMDVRIADKNHKQLMNHKQRFLEPLKSMCTEFRRLQLLKSQKEERKGVVKTAIDNHTRNFSHRYLNAINLYLGRFNAGFEIHDISHNHVGGTNTSFLIKINSIPVAMGDERTPIDIPSFKNTLSSGDKSTLALSIFLAQVHIDDGISDRIIVLDDPFNSQDAFRRVQTALEIVRSGNDCCQTIVLSHDPHFLHDLSHKIRSAAQTRILRLNRIGLENTTIHEFDISEYLSSELKQNITAMQTYHTVGEGLPVEVARIIRPTLETYYRNCYPTIFLPTHTLGHIVSIVRGLPEGHNLKVVHHELHDINDYTTPFAHGSNQNNIVINPDELIGCIQRTLRIVGAS